MADLADVETALVDALIAALYPNGPAAASVAGAACKIYRGWPMAAALDADRAAGNVNVTVFPQPGATRNTTRWGVVQETVVGAARLTAVVTGNAATFAGLCQAGQLAGVLVDGQPYVYAVQDGDVPPLVAAVLADAIRADRICWLTGAMLTVPGASAMIARTAAKASTREASSSQEQGFRISVWSPTPGLRDTTCSIIGAQLGRVSFLSLADGSGGRLRYRATSSFDNDAAGSLYRRELIYDVDYATTTLTTAAVMLFGDLTCNGTTIFR